MGVPTAIRNAQGGYDELATHDSNGDGKADVGEGPRVMAANGTWRVLDAREAA